MKLKALYKNEADIPEAFKELYEKDDDGNWILNVDDADYKVKLNEFRANNVNLKKEKDKLEKDIKRFDGVDPEKYQKAVEALAKLDESEESELIKAGKLDEVVEKRVEAIKKANAKEVERLNAALESTSTTLKTKATNLKRLLIRTKVTDAITSAGQPKTGAMADILNRAESVWDTDDDDNLVGKDLFNESGKPMTLDEWSKKMLQDAPHLFEPGTGGGAGGGKKGDGGDKKGVKTIYSNDPLEFGRNAEAIAAGKVVIKPAAD